MLQPQRRLRCHSIAYARAAGAAEAAHDMYRAAGKCLQEVRAGGDYKAGLGKVNDLVERGGVGAAAKNKQNFNGSTARSNAIASKNGHARLLYRLLDRGASDPKGCCFF